MKLTGNAKWWIGIAVAIVTGIVMPVAAPKLLLKGQSLAFEMDFFAPPAPTGGNSKLELLYEKRAVPNIRFDRYVISNVGDAAIRKDDFESPIKIYLGDRSKVLEARVIRTRPNNVAAQVHIEKSAVLIQPFLLNPRESVVIEAVSTGSRFPDIQARIANTTILERFGPAPVGALQLLTDVAVALMLFVAIGAIGTIVRSQDPKTKSGGASLGASVLLLFLGIALGAASAALLRAFMPNILLTLALAAFTTPIGAYFGWCVTKSARRTSGRSQ